MTGGARTGGRSAGAGTAGTMTAGAANDGAPGRAMLATGGRLRRACTRTALGLALGLALGAGPGLSATATPERPAPRPAIEPIPAARWDDARGESDRWALAARRALKTHGRALVSTVPRDIEDWCPGYRGADDADRRAFWTGFLSSLAKYESTYRPTAVGGGGRWFGLLQILPTTARGYGCEATSGAALKDGGRNLACAIRIMARTVPRDGVIFARSPRWSGVAADWGPMRSEEKRAEMSRWLRGQDYCRFTTTRRPAPRPDRGPAGDATVMSAAAPIPSPRPAPRPAVETATLLPRDLDGGATPRRGGPPH